ncbi:MAG: hypothetical protein LBR72_04450 [Oscillospiraceae bacterium]|jgi:hypothetical protein|nr:hypothetical protein [Oscillospiraceae bacterium]
MSKHGFQYYGGIVGSPTLCENEWSDEQMEALKDLGINMLQLNLAWGGRPGNEVLNLEDLDGEHMEQFRHRLAQSEKYGFRVMPHFGVPRMAQKAPPRVVASCILDPEVREKYKELLLKLLRDFPALNDVMIYTYDQDSWICDEFGDCPRCGGIPIYERLPGFLNEMKEALQLERPGATLWWQPWEISAGQTYKIIEKIDPAHFGVVINNALAETYFINTTDMWVRTTVRMCHERNIPVIGEIQITGCGIGCHSVQRLPCPRLVYDQIEAFAALDGVIGVREHFGIVLSKLSVNTSLFAEYVKAPQDGYDALVSRVAEKYGDAAPLLLEAWEEVSNGVKYIPYDGAYPLTNVTFFGPGHSWDGVEFDSMYWETPAWESNRRAFYMVTRPSNIHPWLIEDIGIRLGYAAECILRAAALLAKAAEGSAGNEDIRAQYEDTLSIGRSLLGTSLHYKETLAAHDLRFARTQNDKEKWDAAEQKLRKLLELDCENQNNAEEVKSQLDAFNADPNAWINSRMVVKFNFLQKNPILRLT